MRVLVVDHFDSFVYNLVQLVGSLGHETLVVRSNQGPASHLVELRPDAVILSPGPGRPERAGCFVELVLAVPDDVPVLGVCLGHQAIAVAFGALVVRAPSPVHGKASSIRHAGCGVLAGLPDPFGGGRYHSLVVDRATVPGDLAVTAETDDGLVMALQHRELPRFGVQFHPESILTPDGAAVVRNFLATA